MHLLTCYDPPPSPARTRPPERGLLRVALVQQRWHPEPQVHRDALAEGVRTAAAEGARLVCLQELTLTSYFAVRDDETEQAAAAHAEPLPGHEDNILGFFKDPHIESHRAFYQ